MDLLSRLLLVDHQQRLTVDEALATRTSLTYTVNLIIPVHPWVPEAVVR